MIQFIFDLLYLSQEVCCLRQSDKKVVGYRTKKRDVFTNTSLFSVGVEGFEPPTLCL